MTRRICLLIGFAVLITFLGCGGGEKIQMPKGGVKLSYAPAVGKTSSYRTMVQKYIQASEQGMSYTRLVKGDVTFETTVIESGEGGAAKMDYKFIDVGVGVFENNQLQSSEEVDDMLDLELTVILDTTGSMEEIEGVDLDEEYRKEEISPISFILTFPVPGENVYIGYSWIEEQDTTIEDEDGIMTQKTYMTYEVVDFIMLEGFRCIICNTTGKVDITQKGESESEDVIYEIDMKMAGEVKGKISFDIDNGRIVRLESNKMIDVKGSQINTDTGEKNPIIYYNQETQDARLLLK